MTCTKVRFMKENKNKLLYSLRTTLLLDITIHYNNSKQSINCFGSLFYIKSKPQYNQSKTKLKNMQFIAI